MSRPTHRRPAVRTAAATATAGALAAVAVLAAGAPAGGAARSATAARAAAPEATSTPTVSGTPQEGQKLTGGKGTWSGTPTDFNYSWTRCDKNGDSCAAIGGATGATYTLTSADVGNTLRFSVQAKNASGSTTAASVPTAIVTAQGATTTAATTTAPAPAATGCPKGNGPVAAKDVSAPARLLLDGQQVDPDPVTRRTPQMILRYHVSTTCGQSVQGALVYVSAVPFGQFDQPAEQVTGNDGWAEVVLHPQPGLFPVSPRQQLVALFVRARKSGEDILAGISARRLFSVKVRLG